MHFFTCGFWNIFLFFFVFSTPVGVTAEGKLIFDFNRCRLRKLVQVCIPLPWVSVPIVRIRYGCTQTPPTAEQLINKSPSKWGTPRGGPVELPSIRMIIDKDDQLCFTKQNTHRYRSDLGLILEGH